MKDYHIKKAEAYYQKGPTPAAINAAKSLKRLHMHRLFKSVRFEVAHEGQEAFARSGLKCLVLAGNNLFEIGEAGEWQRTIDDDGCDVSFKDIGTLRACDMDLRVTPMLIRFRLPRARPRSMHPVSYSSFRLNKSRIAWAAGICVDDGGEWKSVYFERTIAAGMLSAARAAQSMCEWYMDSAIHQNHLENAEA